jgi:beta-aspartyl-peptidase (threonine type)
MKNLIWLFLLLLLAAGCGQATDKDSKSYDRERPQWAIVVHGGAGMMQPEAFPAEVRQAYAEKISEALNAGGAILQQGGASLDAVEAAVRVLEDSPMFNAGKGAVFSAAGINELDASVMDGKTGKAGAVAGVTVIRNPIAAARRVMEASPHVMLAGAGAESFATEQGLAIVDKSYFYTEDRWQSLLRARQRAEEQATDTTEKHGTVGCVALDKNGNLAAATSTGGMTNKKYGRIGDSPIIGAGTYADNATCAVSCTGHGEYFITNAVAYDVAARIKYFGQSLQEAAGEIINKKLKSQGAEGGLIAIDSAGNIAMPFNTSGMFRGYLLPDSLPKISIFKDE